MFGTVGSFSGSDGTVITLYKDHIKCKGESHSLSGVSSHVESGTDLQSRVTATRLLAFGVFALAFKKKKGGEKYLIVEGDDFVWMAEVGRKQIKEAMKFSSEVNNQARKQ